MIDFVVKCKIEL